MKKYLYSMAAEVENRVSPHQNKITGFETGFLNASNAQDFRLATAHEDYQLINMVQSLYDQESMDAQPKIIIYEQDIPNAAFIHSGTLAFSTGLLNRMNQEQLKAVAAHEVTHQQQKSVNLGAFITRALAATAAGIYAASKIIGNLPERFSGSNGNGGFKVFANIVTFSAFFKLADMAVSPIHTAFKRRQETRADDGSVRITQNPDALISALHVLEQYPEERRLKRIPATDPNSPQKPQNYHDVVSQSSLKPKQEPSTLKKIWQKSQRHHPETSKRVERLLKQRAEIEAAHQSTHQI